MHTRLEALADLHGPHLDAHSLQALRDWQSIANAQVGEGKINWCGLAKSAQAVIDSLTAAGVAIPAYLTLVVSTLSAFCPAQADQSSTS